MSAPVLFARARESAAVLARAETLLRTPADVADVVVEATLPEREERAVLEPSLFFARACQSRQRLAKYNPDQKRDDEGKWTAFGGIPAFAKEHLFADGTVKAKVDKGGLQLSLANNAGGVGKSGGLDTDARQDLARALEVAAEWDPDTDGYPAEGDGPEMVRRAVYTYPEDGDENSTPTGFAQVGHDGTGNIELELLDSDATVKLSRAEAKQLSDSVSRSAGVSRVGMNHGPLDVFPTEDRKIGLRLNAADRSVAEPVFDGSSWTRLTRAVDVVWEGYDDSESFVETEEDDNGDVVYPDVDRLEVDTSAGRMSVRRQGATTNVRDADYGSETLAFGPVDGSWEVAWPGHHEHPVFGAFTAVEDYAAEADFPGIENAAPRLPSAVVWRPLVAGVKLLPRAEFTESKHKRDRKGRARVTAHLPGEHNQKSHGNSVSSPNAIKGVSVIDAAEYETLYGDEQDGAGIDLSVDDDELGLSARYFGTGDMHVVLELEDGKRQVLEEMDPGSMRQLAYDIEDLLAVDETEFVGGDPYDIVEERNSDVHDFFLAKDGVGDIRLVPGEADGDYLELSPEQAQDFVNVLLDVADSYEEYFADDRDVLEELAETASQGPVTNAAIVLPYNHPGHPDQKVHGRPGRRMKKGASWAERIATGVADEKQLSDPENASHVYLVTFGDGSRAVAKYPKADYEMAVGELDAEELGASVARVLGLSPPEVHRAEDQEAYFTYLGDTDPDAVVGATADFDKSAGSIDAKRIGLLDVLTENTDRNSGNWFATPDGRIIPIDHGMSWAPARTERDGPETAHWPSGFAEAYTAKVGAGVQPGQWVYDPSLFEAKWVDNDLSKEYVASLRPKLKALRPEFERLGHTDWHDRMMARLDIVEQHAKGTVAL